MVRSERLADLFGRDILVPTSDPNASIVSAADAISHLPPIEAGQAHDEVPNHRARSLSDLNLKRLGSALPGQSNAYMTQTEYGDLSLDCHRRVNSRFNERCFGDVYTWMRPNHPSPTITTKCHSISNGRFGHVDTSQLRGISLRDAATLQSFPDDYVFYPTDQVESVARMIGNAVPPRLAQYFASYFVDTMDSEARASLSL
jgi:DNA (cytosine-5)-methyltransferase 1